MSAIEHDSICYVCRGEDPDLLQCPQCSAVAHAQCLVNGIALRPVGLSIAVGLTLRCHAGHNIDPAHRYFIHGLGTVWEHAFQSPAAFVKSLGVFLLGTLFIACCHAGLLPNHAAFVKHIAIYYIIVADIVPALVLNRSLDLVVLRMYVILRHIVLGFAWTWDAAFDLWPSLIIMGGTSISTLVVSFLLVGSSAAYLRDPGPPTSCEAEMRADIRATLNNHSNTILGTLLTVAAFALLWHFFTLRINRPHLLASALGPNGEIGFRRKEVGPSREEGEGNEHVS